MLACENIPVTQFCNLKAGPGDSGKMTANREIGHVDAALHKLGPFRRYTLVQFSINIMSQFAVATHMLSIVFTGKPRLGVCVRVQ